MKYSKKEIGKELKKELEKGYSITRISDWACRLFAAYRNQHFAELDDILPHISLMDAGPRIRIVKKNYSFLNAYKGGKRSYKKINDRKVDLY